MPHPLLLEINTRCWLREQPARKGLVPKLGDVPAARMKEWRLQGFTHVWLMGVWATGPRARQQALDSPALRREYDEVLPGWTADDVPGSPYAIADYEVATALGGNDGLAALRRKLRSAGLKLILDFVPNHLGLDHPWIASHPERFVQSDDVNDASFIGGSADYPVRLCHGRDPYFAPWPDTVQLDLRRAETRRAVIDQLVRVAGLCDGVRCDMAMLLLDEVFDSTWSGHGVRGDRARGEFWQESIARVRQQHPEFQFIAEAYWGREAELLKLGFDFAYHKSLTDALLDHPEDVTRVLAESVAWSTQAVPFLENHDERRVAAVLKPDHHRTAAAVTLFLPGLRMVYDGQLAGARIKTPVQLGRRQTEAVDSAVAAIYRPLLALLQETAIGRGEARILFAKPAWEDNPTHRWFVLIQWQAALDRFQLVVINLAPHRSQCYAPLEVAGLAARQWNLVDLLGGEHHFRAGEDLQSRGLYLDVPAHAVQVFDFTVATDH